MVARVLREDLVRVRIPAARLKIIDFFDFFWYNKSIGYKDKGRFFKYKFKNMDLVPFNPFKNIEQWFEDEDWALPIISQSSFKEPAIDIYQTDNDVVVEMNVPDFDPEKIDISVKNQVLTVKGETEKKEEEKKKNYWKKEIRRGSFERSIRLPIEIDEDKVEATYDKGILKIVMPKKFPSSTAEEKKIKVKSK